VKATLYIFGGPRPIQASPDKITIEEAEGMHDLATLQFRGDYGRSIVSQLDLSNVTAQDIGPPAVVETIASNVLELFYGYIDTTVETRTITDSSSEEIYFLAATSIMRNGRSRVWRDKRPFDIASEIVDSYGFGLEMDKLPHPMASFTQANESDWEALRNLAVLNGLSLSASGTIVKLKDVINETRRAKGSNLTPQFRRPGSRYSRGLEASRFVQVASRTPIGGEQYRYYGVDQLGASFEVSGGVSPISKSPGVVVNSLGAALRESRRHEAMGRFVTRASLEANGVAGCSAGDCIIVDNERTPEYWYISSSTHALVPLKDEHKMTLELCRQEGTTPGYVSATVPRRPSTVLIGKEWRCDRQWRIEL
jgi:hypothetical protein